jgi:exonuclease VII small subunit
MTWTNNTKLKTDLWFSDTDDVPWFIQETAKQLSFKPIPIACSCYAASDHNFKEILINKYGIRRREARGMEYGHHFVFVDKNKFETERIAYLQQTIEQQENPLNKYIKDYQDACKKVEQNNRRINKLRLQISKLENNKHALETNVQTTERIMLDRIKQHKI